MTEKSDVTKRQQQVYEFIIDKIRERGYGPTVREIGKAFKIRSPNGVICHLAALQRKGKIRREPNRSRAISIVDDVDLGDAIPLSGTIAAGMPLETFEESESVDFGAMFGKAGYFALKVRGHSMIEDHIQDGDFVVVRKQHTARDGQIVVALVDGSETTLKRLYRDKGRYRLEPANSTMKPIYCDRLDILGVVAGVVRKIDGNR